MSEKALPGTWTPPPALAVDTDPAAQIQSGQPLFRPATFGQRLAARLLDGVVCSIPVFVLYVALGASIALFGSLGGALLGLALGPLLITLGTGIAALLYYQLCETSGGRTVGRAAAGIRLVNVTGSGGQSSLVGGWQAFGRRLVSAVGDLVFLLGSLSMLWQSDKRTWADRVSGTAVIQSRETFSTNRGVRAGAIATAITAAAVVALVGTVAATDGLLDTSDDSSAARPAGGSTTGNGQPSTVDPAQSTRVARDAVVPSQAPDGVDSAGNATNYDPANMFDDVNSSAWRMRGDGSGSDITITLSATKTVTSLGLINGYAKTDPASGVNRYTQERRITGVTWTFDDGTVFAQKLDPNDESMQTIALDTPKSTGQVVLHIADTTRPGDHKFNYTAISELDVEGQ